MSRAIARAKQGDREALHFLYVRYADNVYGYVKSIVRDEHAAEDVTQHVFAKLMVVLPRYEEREVPFFAWILRVARNVALDHVRRRVPTPCADVRAVGDGYESEENDRAIALREAFSELPDDQREVLFLRHVIGFLPLEIADRLGRTESSVHGLHHRGRGRLKTLLGSLDLAPVTVAG